MTKQPIDSVTYAELRELLQTERYKGQLQVLGQSSAGLEVVVKRPEGYQFYTVTDLSIALDHRHTPASSLSQLNQSAAGVTADTVVNNVNFTPEKAPYSFFIFWQFTYSGVDNDLDGLLSQAFTLAIVTGGLSKDLQQQYSATPAGGIQWGSLFISGRQTTTNARQFNSRTRELVNGVPRDTVDIGSSDLSVLVVYEQGI